MRFGWIVANTTANIASTRYRCYYPAMALAEHGVESMVFSASQDAYACLRELDAIVFVKRLDSDSVRLATEARARGKRIYIDLCDNVVIPNYEAEAASQQVPWLAAVSVVADAIITTNSALTESLRPVLSAKAQFYEIPDQIETRASVEQARKFSEPFGSTLPGAGSRLAGSISLQTSRLHSLRRRGSLFLRSAVSNPSHASRVLRRKLSETVKRVGALRQPRLVNNNVEQKIAAAKTVLWFGNYGSPYSDFGMLALLRAAPALENVARDIEFELVVVSNNRDMFENCIAPLALPTRYVEWSPNAVFDALQTAMVCLLPSGRDAFSLTKSANRALLALHHGVPVISSTMRSLEPLARSIVLDDWEGGLRRFLGSQSARRGAIETARPVIDALYTPQAIARAWLHLLDQYQPHRALRSKADWGKIKVGIVIDLIQDVDVLLPVIDEIRSRDAATLRVIVTDAVTEKSPRALRLLIEREIIPYYLERKAVLAGDDRTLKGLDCLLAASESTLPVHQTCHALVVLARELGINTFTLQHGLENVGLTYFDDVHGGDVMFASDHILTWSSQDGLPTTVPPETKAKCIAVGRTNRVHTLATPRPAEWGAKTAIGVFENLHWHRYSPGYREAFVRDLLGLATLRDDIVLIIKPHQAGRFLAKERSLLDGAPPNIFVLDPRDPRWEPYTAGAVLPHCAGVITTPSSAALDAAELNIPVAVAAYDLEVAAYAPLSTLHSLPQWLRFVEAALSRNECVLSVLREFRDRVRIPGDAAKRAADVMFSVSQPTTAEHRMRQRATAIIDVCY